MPKSWLITTSPATLNHTLSIELSKPAKEINIDESKTEKAAIEENIEQPMPLVDTEQAKPSEVPPKKEIEKPPIPKKDTQNHKPKKSRNKLSVQQKTPAIDASDVQIMMSKAVDPTIKDVAFTARSGNNQFISKQYVTNDLYADLPYLDESVDAPRVQMQFYSAGYMGSVERFFDKITYKKTFTTKYGTKIHCALVGVIALCGWK